ncbi:MAG: glycine cleavage system aminomethyltransferase GcvT [candidate division WOR-3 bacterium]
MLKRTPFYDKHIKLNAKMVPFAGFEMPVQYEGIIKETIYAREKLVIFDVSHMGEIEIKGKDALKFLSYVVSNDPSLLKDYQVQYAVLLNENGGSVDDLLIYKLPDRYFLVVNAANTLKDYNFLCEMSKNFDVEIKNLSDEIAQLAIQGPLAEPHLVNILELNLSNVKFYWSIETKYKDIPILISRTGYTGEDGFEIYVRKEYADFIWNEVFKGDIKPAGLGARDTLRLEMGYPLYGHELDDDTSPLEAGLKRFVKVKENFLGKERIIKELEEGIKKKLIGFYSEEKGVIPREKMKIFSDGEEIGYVTSGTFSPNLNKGIGMGYVRSDFEGEKIYIDIRGKIKEFKITSLPFVKETSLKIPKKRKE